MSLPQYFNNPEKYFEECLKFFQEYQYLFNNPNTDLLIHNLLDKITVKDEAVDVFGKDFDLSSIDDEFLSAFFTKLKKLQVFYDDIQEDSSENDINVPVSLKKKHEILHLAKQIQEACEYIGCEVVVDFGSGLVRFEDFLVSTKNILIIASEMFSRH